MVDTIPPISSQYWLTAPMQRGGEIWMAQDRLAKLGEAVAVDGVFGAATRIALMTFQRKAGLQVDGILGPRTWRALFGGTASDQIDLAAADYLEPDKLAIDHRRYPDSVQWRIGPTGLAISGNRVAAPTPAEKALTSDVYTNFGRQIRDASARYKVPVELVVATICTESGGKPFATRYEPGCDLNNPERTPHRVSVGLMQTLLSTAREALSNDNLRLVELTNPQTSILAGMAYMWRQARQTGFDPPLVAAAYNAGSLRYTTRNRWKLVSTGNHVDRFVNFFNACWVECQKSPLAPPAVTFTDFFKNS